MKPRRQQNKRTEGFAGNAAVEAVLANRGFPPFRRVPEAGRLTSVLPESWAGGIYVFECEDGEGYVGQTRGALSTRLSSHRRSVPGIRAVTFLRTRRALLDERERQVHEELQRAGLRLKNITFARLEAGPSVRFAEIMPEEDQSAWLADPRLIVRGEMPRAQVERTTRAGQLFEQYCSHPAAWWMTRAMGRYVWRTIPDPPATERAFWSLTLRLESDGGVSLRLNVGAQTTLDLYGNQGWGTRVRIFTPRTRFERAFGFPLPERTWGTREQETGVPFVADSDYGSLRAFPSTMVEAGTDQYSIDGPLEPMMSLLERAEWIHEARAMQLDMMQRRKGINGRSHNPFVADDFLEEDPTTVLGNHW